MDAPEEPLDYPVETPAIPGGRIEKLRRMVNEMSHEEYEEARTELLGSDFQTT